MKKITVQKLLNWAFVHELPKGGGADGIYSPRSAWGLMEQVGSLGVHIDLNRGRQDLPACFEQGEPHPDALIVGQAVRKIMDFDFALDNLSFEMLPLHRWNEQARTLAEPIFDSMIVRLKNCSKQERGCSVIALVVSCAVLEKEPEHSLPLPKLATICRGGSPCWFIKQKRVDSFGRETEVEVDGFNYKSRRPWRGAYLKHLLNPSPEGNFENWVNYQLWKKSLKFLYHELNGKLSDFCLIPS